MKKAVCQRTVPAIQSPTGQDIAVGTIIKYRRTVFDNGQHHLLLAGGKLVPDIFFNTKPAAVREASATAAMAYARAMNAACRLDGDAMLRAVDQANKAALAAGIDPAKVGLN